MNSSTRATLLFFGAFLVFHGLSLLSYFYPALLPLFFFMFLGAAVVLAFWRPALAAVPIILELLLDSSGHLFEWRDISLRLAVLLLVLLSWLYHAYRSNQLLDKLMHPFTIVYAFILAIVGLAALSGWSNGHEVRLIIADAIPFIYLALFYPLKDLSAWILKQVQDDKRKKSSILDTHYSILIGSFLGAAVASIIVLFLFSSGLEEIQGPFYKWWRDMVAGKATATGNGFYRIVTPLHLFLTALVPYVAYRLLSMSFWRPKADRISSRGGSYRSAALRSRMTYLVLLLTILLVPVINFSRIYFLAIIPAVLVMAIKLPWKKVVLTLVIIGVVSIAEYSLVNLAASRGQSVGFEFLYGQSRGIIDPESEASASARAAILPHLVDAIQKKPFSGVGLGATVMYYNPFLEKKLTTPHLDWGYLEMAVEYGIVATLFFIFIVGYLFWRSRHNPLISSVLIFLAVVTITAPALFHVYGITLILAIFLIPNQTKTLHIS